MRPRAGNIAVDNGFLCLFRARGRKKCKMQNLAKITLFAKKVQKVLVFTLFAKSAVFAVRALPGPPAPLPAQAGLGPDPVRPEPAPGSQGAFPDPTGAPTRIHGDPTAAPRGAPVCPWGPNVVPR